MADVRKPRSYRKREQRGIVTVSAVGTVTATDLRTTKRGLQMVTAILDCTPQKRLVAFGRTAEALASAEGAVVAVSGIEQESYSSDGGTEVMVDKVVQLDDMLGYTAGSASPSAQIGVDDIVPDRPPQQARKPEQFNAEVRTESWSSTSEEDEDIVP